MSITKEQFEEYKKSRKRKGGTFYDDLEELEEMWIREIVREEISKAITGFIECNSFSGGKGL